MFLLRSLALEHLVTPLSQEKDEVLQGHLFDWLDHTLKLLGNYL